MGALPTHTISRAMTPRRINLVVTTASTKKAFSTSWLIPLAKDVDACCIVDLAAGTPWVRFDQGPRLEAPFRQTPESSWCNRGRSEVATWSQERKRDQSLFWRGAGAVDRGGKQSFSDGLAWAGTDHFEEEAGVKT